MMIQIPYGGCLANITCYLEFTLYSDNMGFSRWKKMRQLKFFAYWAAPFVSVTLFFCRVLVVVRITVSYKFHWFIFFRNTHLHAYQYYLQLSLKSFILNFFVKSDSWNIQEYWKYTVGHEIVYIKCSIQLIN